MEDFGVKNGWTNCGLLELHCVAMARDLGKRAQAFLWNTFHLSVCVLFLRKVICFEGDDIVQIWESKAAWPRLK